MVTNMNEDLSTQSAISSKTSTESEYIQRKNTAEPNPSMQDLMEAIVDAYENMTAEPTTQTVNTPSYPILQLNHLAQEFGITPLKARKLLITAGYYYHKELYSTPTSQRVNALHAQGKSIAEIMEITGLSRASVHGYLPYSKSVYKTAEVSAAADRIRLYRERRNACERLRAAIYFQDAKTDINTDMGTNKKISVNPSPDIDECLWQAITAFSGYPFYTSKGLKYSYTVTKRRDGSNGGEMLISRKEKSITKATVLIAFHKALELMRTEGRVSGPKKLGTFGASYLYPVFIRLFLNPVNPANPEEPANV